MNEMVSASQVSYGSPRSTSAQRVAAAHVRPSTAGVFMRASAAVSIAFSLATVVSACVDGDLTPTPATRSSVAEPAPPSPLAPLGVVALARDDEGAPTLVRAVRALAAHGDSPEQAARAHLTRLAPGYGVRALPALVHEATLSLEGGAHIVTFAQHVAAAPVHEGPIDVLLDRSNALLAVSGRLADQGRASRSAVSISPADALARALRSLYGGDVTVLDETQAVGGYVRFAVAPRADLVVSDSRARLERAPRGGRLEPVYVVELDAGSPDATTAGAYRVLVHAVDGAILEIRDLVLADAFTYRVHADAQRVPTYGPIADILPHPVGTPGAGIPPFVASSLVTVETIKTRPAGAVDPWLPSGATQTNGNNVDAYSDAEAPDGLSGSDFRATITSPATFDRAYDPALAAMSSVGQRAAAITQLFYTINHLHDYWYDSGFDEAHANAQASNRGRGGLEGDAMLAEAQDGYGTGSRDNANMAAHADGMSPKMQMYVWTDGTERDSALDATIVQHEWGHYLHLRLAACGLPQCSAMSEGWGDFVALHAQVRAGDDLDGVYALAAYAALPVTDAAYFGIRRVPYTRDFAKNALTFRHISDGVALPAHPSVSLGPNSEVHNAGEIWASALFEAYGAVLENHPFEVGKRRFADYVVASLLLTPNDATFTEARDALLTAAQAIDPADALDIAAAFALRGMGTCAVSPARDSENLAGVVETFVLAPRVEIAAVALTPADGSCDDDTYLDAAETGTVAVTLTNAGAAPATTQVTLTSSTADLAIGAPSQTVTVPPLATRVVAFDVSLDPDVTATSLITLTASTTTAGDCDTSHTREAIVRVHADETPGAATGTSFDTTTLDLTREGGDAEDVWTVARTAMGAHVEGADVPYRSDTSIVTPALVVHPTDPFVVAFQHRYRFEVDMGALWDGGLLEISVDGGAFVDVSAYVDPGYDGMITNEPDAESPIIGRAVYGGQSASYPALEPVTLDFGTALAGKTVRLRFRIGTDVAAGDEGWRIDDLAVTGITNTPFTRLGAHAGDCDAPAADGGVPDGGDVTPPGSDDGGCGCAAAGAQGHERARFAVILVAMVLARRARPRRR